MIVAVVWGQRCGLNFRPSTSSQTPALDQSVRKCRRSLSQALDDGFMLTVTAIRNRQSPARQWIHVDAFNDVRYVVWGAKLGPQPSPLNPKPQTES